MSWWFSSSLHYRTWVSRVKPPWCATVQAASLQLSQCLLYALCATPCHFPALGCILSFFVSLNVAFHYLPWPAASWAVLSSSVHSALAIVLLLTSSSFLPTYADASPSATCKICPTPCEVALAAARYPSSTCLKRPFAQRGSTDGGGIKGAQILFLRGLFLGV